MAAEREIKIKFDGSADGFARAAKRAQRALSEFERQAGRADGMGKAGAKAGQTLMQEMAMSIGRIGPKMLGLGGPVAAVLVPAVVVIGSAMGAALSAAVSAGISVGVIAAGIALVARHPKIKAAFKGLGNEMISELTTSAAVFSGPLLNSVEKIRSTFRSITPDIRATFASASRYVEPLVDGLLGMARNIMPAVRRAVEGAAPVIQVLRRNLPRLGDTIGKALDTITKNAPAAAAGLEYMFIFLEKIISGGAGFISFLGSTFVWLIKVGDAAATVADTLWGWVPLLGDRISSGRESIERLKGSMESAKTAGEDWKVGVNQLGVAQQSLADKTRAATEAANRQREAAISLYGAQTSTAEAIARANQTIKENGRTHRLATQAGRENRTALDQLAGSIRTEVQALKDSGAATGRVNARQAELRAKLVAAARAAGYGATEASNLADKLLGIPKKTTPEVNLKDNASGKISNIKTMLNGIRSKTITVTVNGRVIGERMPGGGVTLKNRWGGMHDYAMARGGTLNAHFVKKPTVLYGERQTGGEAYIPRKGSLRRSRVIAERVVRDWLGGDVSWGTKGPGPRRPAPSGGGEVSVSVSLDGQPFYAHTTTAVRSAQRRAAWRDRVGRR